MRKFFLTLISITFFLSIGFSQKSVELKKFIGPYRYNSYIPPKNAKVIYQFENGRNVRKSNGAYTLGKLLTDGHPNFTDSYQGRVKYVSVNGKKLASLKVEENRKKNIRKKENVKNSSLQKTSKELTVSGSSLEEMIENYLGSGWRHQKLVGTIKFKCKKRTLTVKNDKLPLYQVVAKLGNPSRTSLGGLHTIEINSLLLDRGKYSTPGTYENPLRFQGALGGDEIVVDLTNAIDELEKHAPEVEKTVDGIWVQFWRIFGYIFRTYFMILLVFLLGHWRFGAEAIRLPETGRWGSVIMFNIYVFFTTWVSIFVVFGAILLLIYILRLINSWNIGDGLFVFLAILITLAINKASDVAIRANENENIQLLHRSK